MSLTMTTALAQGEPASEEKPYIFASQNMQITAQVEAIDHETRVVSLRGPEGNILTFTASDEARNLGQVEVGDLVNALYVQNMSIELYDNPDQVQPTGGELAGLARTEEGRHARHGCLRRPGPVGNGRGDQLGGPIPSS